MGINFITFFRENVTLKHCDDVLDRTIDYVVT